MHDIVKDEDLSALAAEYVIGTLDPDERTRANVLLEVDEGFRALVRAWERRLGELHLMVEPVEPDGRIWERVRGRLGIRAPEAAPPPFAPAPPSFVSPPPPPPFGAPAARAPAAEPRFEPKFEPAFESRLEPRLETNPESRFELPPAPQLQAAQEEAAQEKEEEQDEDVFAPDAVMPEATTPAALTTEQQLAGLIREADRFSEPRAADAPPTITTFEPVAIAPDPQVEAAAGTEPDAEAPATTEHEDLLKQAADTISVKEPAEADPAEADKVEGSAPEPIMARTGHWPAGAANRESMLAPADLARVALKGLERRIDTWRAAMLFMTVVALGLGSLIAAWRYAPEHLPPRLQPNTILGLPDLGPSERIPAQHGTQFEE
jgi:hypothetical protein